MNETLKRILELNNSKGNDDKTFELELKLKPKTVNNWKRGLSEGYMKMLPQIADYFDVSVDYLLGRTDSPSRESAEIDENEIRFALYEGEKALLTDSDEEEIKNFVRFVVDKRKKETNK